MAVKSKWKKYGLRVDPDELRDKRRIDRHNLDEEIETQAELYGEAAEAAAMSKSFVEKMEEELKTLDSSLDKVIRQKAEADEERITETQIKAKISSSPKRKKLVLSLLGAKEDQRILEALASSLKQRSYMLRDMVDLFLAGYYGETSAKGSAKKKIDYDVDRQV